MLILGRLKHIAEKLLSEFSPFEVGIAIENLRKYKFPGINQILLELIQAEDETLHI
jgi:hypothetical protein